jgi:hypothetical protein
MPHTFTDLPPDHPIFSTGPSFVFRAELPPPPSEDEPADEESE